MHRIRLTAAVALSATVALGGLAVAAPARAAGGLSISPSLIERTATPGSIGSLRVTNDSGKAMNVSVTARPWVQARTGVSKPDERRKLSQIRLTGASFKLAAGASRSVPASLLKKPSGGSLYGTLSVIGTPEGAKPKNGVVARYRLLGALRLNAPSASQRFKASVGTPRYRGGATLLPVRNTGNTVAPITGTATVKGPSGTRRASFTPVRVLPGATVDLRLPQGKLAKGKYKVTFKLTQAGRQLASTSRSFRVK
jgi:hypothetical protein